MRWPRLVGVLTFVAIMLIGTGWQLLGSAHAARRATAAPLARHATAQAGVPRSALERQLQRFLSTTPLRQPEPRVVPLRPLTPHPTTCFLATGGCSDTPCVEFAGQAGAAIAATSSAVVLRLGGVINRSAVPQVGRSSCQGHLGTPKLFRVSLR
jgi:hypothetical protein